MCKHNVMEIILNMSTTYDHQINYYILTVGEFSMILQKQQAQNAEKKP